jgi:hypothetical protein
MATAKKKKTTKSTPEPAKPAAKDSHQFKAGQVYATSNRAYAVITAVGHEGLHVAPIWQPGMATSTSWEELHKKARLISVDVATHHCTTGSWQFKEDVEKRWAK